MKSITSRERTANFCKLQPLDLSLKPLKKNNFNNFENQQRSLRLTDSYNHTKSYDTMFNQYEKQELIQKERQMKERLDKLNNNLKLMEKKYKQNLKQGFDNKIKAYRLQAVMQRKLLKQTIQLQKKKIQQSELEQKHKKTIQKKYYQSVVNQKIKHHKKQKVKKIKQDYLKQKQKLEITLSLKKQTIMQNNRSLREKILSEEKQKDRKKNYLQFWRLQQFKREEFEMKKDFLQKIVNNSKKLSHLKDQLHRLKQKEIEIDSVRHNSPFLTI